MHKYFFIIYLLTQTLSLQAQKNHLQLSINGEVSEITLTSLKQVQTTNLDSLSLFKQVQLSQQILFEQGYFLSSANLNKTSDTSFILNITPNKALQWGEIKLTTPDSFTLILPQGLDIQSQVLNANQFKEFNQFYLNYLENNGYPFAQIKLKKYSVTHDTIVGEIFINLGPFITMDSVVIKGYTQLSTNVLRHDLNFKKGMLYNESYIQKLSKLIEQVEYIEFTSAPAVAFVKNKAIIYLYTKEVKSNQIDGVIGLNTDEKGKATFNGDFQLRLLNALKKGEEIKIRWRKPDESISDLNLALSLPYLFKTPFWLQGQLSIFKQDSSFVNTNTEGYLKYLIESGSFISLGIDYNASNVLLETDPNISNNALGSFKTTAYKIGYERRGTNRIIIPTKGNELVSYVFTAKRKTTQESQNQYGFELFSYQYIPIFKSHIIKIGGNTKARFGENLFDNELYRIGGLKTLRGFNEQSIYASAFATGTLEYRYMIGNYDYLTLFSDIAFVEKNTTTYSSNAFLGLGTGMNFRTNGGIFSLFLAVGRDDQQSFDFRAAKIHFGYVNRF